MKDSAYMHIFAQSMWHDEGFNTLVGRVEDSLFDGLAYPYTDEIAQERRDDPVWPHMIPSVREAQTQALAELERKYPTPKRDANDGSGT
jgi:hypothetical protein